MVAKQARKPRTKPDSFPVPAVAPVKLVPIPNKIENTSGWTPSRFRVIVRVDEVPGRSKGGIELPPDYIDMQKRSGCKGTLVAVAGDAFDMERENRLPYPQPGDRVLFAKYAGGEFKGDDGHEYRIMNDEDLMSFKAGD